MKVIVWDVHGDPHVEGPRAYSRVMEPQRAGETDDEHVQRVVDRMRATHPRFASWTVDGVISIEDYLQIRPFGRPK